MSLPGPIVVTGANGRLGRALSQTLADQVADVVRASRPEYDLDDPTAGRRLVETTRPGLVIHAAAWTDVDGCAEKPGLAMRRNASAVAELAEACAEAGAGLVLISTNEVFDGLRTNGRGYTEDDPPRPLNAYGTSKLSGEQAAAAAFARAGRPERLWIIRTAWLFGPPGNDFPSKIVAAAGGLAPGHDLPVVSDEIGSPTYTLDIAPAILELVAAVPGSTFHLVAQGIASRFEFATQVIARCRPAVRVTPISRHEYRRASIAPAWAVLDSGRASAVGISLRSWQPALSSYLAVLCPAPAQS